MSFPPPKILLILLLTWVTSLCSAAAVPTKPPQHVEPRKSYDLSLRWNFLGFLTDDIYIGTPAQQITSLVDWTWINQYVFTTRCHGDLTKTYDCFSPTQKLFNQSRSSTFHNESSLYPSRTWNPNHFFFYQDLTVDYASDVTTIGSGASRTILQASDFQYDTRNAPYPLSGVLGLSPVFKSDNRSTQSPFYQMWSDGVWPEPIIAFHYCYNGSVDIRKSSCGGHDAIQTFGGLHEHLIDGEISWYNNLVFPEVNNIDFIYGPPLYNYWALSLTQLSIGDKVQSLNKTVGAAAIFDHASYGRGAPLSVNAYQELVSLSKAKPLTLGTPLNNGNQSFYEVDCAKTGELPPIKYRFAGSHRDWEIIPKNYVESIGNNTCVLNVRVLGDGDMVAGNFGDTFAKDKYVIFDFLKLRVGLADIKW